MDRASLIDSLHPLEIKVLTTLAGSTASAPLSLETIRQATQLDPSQLNMAVEWLLAKALIRVHSETVTPWVSLTPIGEQQQAARAPIERVLAAVRAGADHGESFTIQQLSANEQVEPAQISGVIGTLKKEGAILIVQGGYVQGTGQLSPTAETLRGLLDRVRGGALEVEALSEAQQSVLRQHAVRRGNTQEPFRIEERVQREFVLTDDGQDAVTRLKQTGSAEEITQLTPELLKDGSWRTKRFRKYTISLRPPRVAPGKRHAYRQFLDTVKAKLVGMGFQEMRGELVETEFWGMDALYMPQFHPARDIHDVYFVKSPSHATEIPQPFLSRVHAAHRDGGKTGSTGWGYEFDEQRTKRLILRSQGTAVSAHCLAGGPRNPGKYFSIARCFRYDQVDATHATDFFQIEGIVLGTDINFRTLLGLLNLFAREVAQAKESKFLPAYFPFTEPSVELHVRHPKLGWMELGGAGLFRPEVTQPLGVQVPVIAWGLGLDRMAMVALGIHDIRDLFTGDLDLIRTTRGKF